MSAPDDNRGLAVATLVLGLLTGGAGMAVATEGSSSVAVPPAVQAPAQDELPLQDIVESCLLSAELAEETVDLAREATGAIAELDARRLQELVDTMQKRDEAIQAQADICRQDSAPAPPS